MNAILYGVVSQIRCSFINVKTAYSRVIFNSTGQHTQYNLPFFFYILSVSRLLLCTIIVIQNSRISSCACVYCSQGQFIFTVHACNISLFKNFILLPILLLLFAFKKHSLIYTGSYIQFSTFDNRSLYKLETECMHIFKHKLHAFHMSPISLMAGIDTYCIYIVSIVSSHIIITVCENCFYAAVFICLFVYRLIFVAACKRNSLNQSKSTILFVPYNLIEQSPTNMLTIFHY